MRIAILTFGSRGDVQPYLALGTALQARGHDVTLAAPENFADWVMSSGLPFVPMRTDVQALLQSPEMRAVIAGNWFKLRTIWRDTVLPMVRATLDATWEAGRDAEVLIYHPKIVGASDVAESTGARLVCASPVPMYQTGAFPLITTGRNFGKWLNRLTWSPMWLSRALYKRTLNVWRRERLGLGPGPLWAGVGVTPGLKTLRLCAVSEAVVPKPDDWDADTHMTGYWFFGEDDDWRPDPELERFLAGEPPVYVGFGSMVAQDPEQLTREIIHGATEAKIRLLIATGWGGVTNVDVPENVHVISSAPHHALFPRCAAVVHHGGAGTTAAGLRSGRPTLICPHSVDQPFWARRIEALGCGPRGLPIKQLTGARFADRLRALTGTPDYTARAAGIAEQLAQEDGIATAVGLIETWGMKAS